MTFLPIVERELRVAARHLSTHWIRIAAALVALLIGAWILLLPGFSSQRYLGIALFVSLSVFTFIYCALAGLRTTADCLSSEKRDGTLGLLFLTDLKGYDIVLGKLAATSLNAFYGILAVFPVMAIPLLLGGVAVAEFWRVVLCSLNNLFFSLSVGMFASAISRDERKAMVAAFLILLCFAGGLPLLGGLTVVWFDLQRPWPGFFIPSPGYASFLAFDEIYQDLARQRFNFFYQSVGCVHLLSWGFLVLTCLIVPWCWQDRAETPTQQRRREWRHQIQFGQGPARRAWRNRLLSLNPILWLTSRDRFKVVAAWFPLLIGGVLWLWGLLKYGRDWRHEGTYVLTALAAHTVFKLWVASEACRHLAQERKSGSLELLLCCPLSIPTILRGQWASLQRQFLGPVVAILAMDLLFLVAEVNTRSWVLLCLAGMSVFVVDLVALSWFGMWCGLATGNASRAMSTACFFILILPWIGWLAALTFLATTGLFRELERLAQGREEALLIGLWWAISLMIDAWFIIMARDRLLTQFRLVATRRPQKSFRLLPSSLHPKSD